MSLNVGDRVSFRKRIVWEDGRTSPEWCCEPGRTFEVLEVSDKGSFFRVVIGNHRKNNGPVTRGVTGAIRVKKIPDFFLLFIKC